MSETTNDVMTEDCLRAGTLARVLRKDFLVYQCRGRDHGMITNDNPYRSIEHVLVALRVEPNSIVMLLWAEHDCYTATASNATASTRSSEPVYLIKLSVGETVGWHRIIRRGWMEMVNAVVQDDSLFNGKDSL